MTLQDIVTGNGKHSACDFRCFLFTSPNRVPVEAEETWHECKVHCVNFEEQLITIYYFDKERGYLMYEYSLEHFLEKIESGEIVIKTDSEQRVGRVQWVEFIPGSIARIEHEADILIGFDN